MHFVYSYIELLKKLFASNHEKEETYETYLKLIYGQQDENNDDKLKEESESSTSKKDEMLS
ncbi:4522_t:CDS:2, partial [Cetraspora pellucida]